jgi:hypothetical protein
VIHHASKAQRLPEMEQIDSVAGERDGTLDGLHDHLPHVVLVLLTCYSRFTRANSYSSLWMVNFVVLNSYFTIHCEKIATITGEIWFTRQKQKGNTQFATKIYCLRLIKVV